MTVKDELHALVADLDDDTAAEVLAYTRWLLAEGQAPAPAAAGGGRWRVLLLSWDFPRAAKCGSIQTSGQTMQGRTRSSGARVLARRGRPAVHAHIAVMG